MLDSARSSASEAATAPLGAGDTSRAAYQKRTSSAQSVGRRQQPPQPKTQLPGEVLLAEAVETGMDETAPTETEMAPPALDAAVQQREDVEVMVHDGQHDEQKMWWVGIGENAEH